MYKLPISKYKNATPKLVKKEVISSFLTPSLSSNDNNTMFSNQ